LYLDTDDRQLEVANREQQEKTSSLPDTTSDVSGSGNDAARSCQLGCQAQPVEIPSSDESSDSEPHKLSRSSCPTRVVESQLSQIKTGIISAFVFVFGARARAGALNAKKQSSKCHDISLLRGFGQ
jgi:hypothetical protein